MIAYNLYPSLSAFNVADVTGRSSSFLFNGAFKGLLFGARALPSASLSFLVVQCDVPWTENAQASPEDFLGIKSTAKVE